jgi:hypothetical protein
MRFNPYILGNLIPPSPYYPVGPDCVLYHAYWDGTAVDHSLAGNNGTNNGGSFVTNGITLDGTADQTVTFTNAAGQLDPMSGFTFFMWFNRTSTDNLRVLILDDNSNGFELNELEVALHTWTRYYPFMISGTLTEEHDSSLGMWHAVAFGLDGLTDPNMYSSINGVSWDLRGTGSGTFSLAHNSNRYHVGNVSPYGFSGTVGELLIFNTFKDLAYIANLFNATKGRYGL